MALVQYDEWLNSTIATDVLVQQHQGISSYSVKYIPMHFQLFMHWLFHLFHIHTLELQWLIKSEACIQIYVLLAKKNFHFSISLI